MKRGFARTTPQPAPVIKPVDIALPSPLKVPAPEGKPWWMVVVAILVIGLVIGMVGITYASGSRTFVGPGSIFPIFMIIGVMSMMFGGRFGGGGQQMSRPKMDKLRAQYTEDGDLIRGIDLLGNAGFVRNVVEKARDHRNDRLDDSDLDALLASDAGDFSEEQLRRFRELTRDDLAEGLTAAVAEKRKV